MSQTTNIQHFDEAIKHDQKILREFADMLLLLGSAKTKRLKAAILIEADRHARNEGANHGGENAVGKTDDKPANRA